MPSNEPIKLLGILSDSHDHVANLTAALQLLQSRGAQFFIHCGDFCQPEMLDHFVGLPAAFVWGNCDDRHALQRYAAAMKLACHGDAGDLTLGGKRIAFLHGDDSARLHQLVTSQQYDYLLHGHTHIQDDRRMARTRIINPGALQRARIKTVALLDLSTDALEILTVA
jgi:uncharacterized protein